MIDPKDLRIGNFIRFNEKFPDDPELELDNEGPMSEDDFNYMLIDNGTFRKNAEYIPLTEEWLNRFGFDKFDGYQIGSSLKLIPTFILNDVYIQSTTEGYWYVRREYDGGTSDPLEGVIEINYVHKLQNLYFALSGQELTPKP